MAYTAQFPISSFLDVDGKPLENGYVYIGTAGLDPVANPQTVYWDAAYTQVAAQPIRTIGGYPSNNGVRSRIYVNAVDYSIKVTNVNGTDTVPVSLLNASNVFAADVIFVQAGAGAVPRTVESKLQESVSVKDFGAVGDGVADDTTAIQNAINAHRGKILFPVGTYKISSTIVVKEERILIGEGAGAYFQGSGYPRISVLQPTAGFSGSKVIDIDPANINAGLNYIYGVAIRDLLIDCINIKNTNKTIINIASLSNTETFDSVRVINNNANIGLSVGISANVSALESDGLSFNNLYFLQADNGGSSTTPLVIVSSANEVSFRDSKFQRGSDPSTASGSMAFQVSASSGRAINALTIDSCSFTGAEVGLRVQGNNADGQGPRWVRVQNCTFEGPKYPIYMSGTVTRPAQFNTIGPGNRMISLAAGGTGIVLDAYSANNQIFADEFTTVLMSTNSQSNLVYGGNTVTDTGTNNARLFRNTNKIDANGFYIEPWTGLSPGSGWVNGSPSNRTSLGYKKDSFGQVYLRGYLTGGSWGFPNYICTLPAGYRPPPSLSYELTANGDAGVAVKIIVTDVGDVFGVGSGASLCLDGIQFPTD